MPIPIILLLSTLVASGQGEMRIEVPRGWESTSLADTAGGHVAIALRSLRGTGAALSIHRGGTFEFVDLPAVADRLTLSPDGGDILVGFEGRDGCSGGALLATTEGGIRWQTRDERRIDFSSSGGSLLAWGPNGRCGAGTQLEMLDLAGRSLRIYDAGSTVGAALAVGHGDRVLLASAGAITLLDLDDAARQLWRLAVAAPVSELTAVGPELFDAALADGSRLLLTATGEVAFTWDPARLARERGGRAARYERFRPYAGDSRQAVDWFDGSPRGFRLDSETGRLSKIRFDASAPKGFPAPTRIRDGWLILDDGVTLLLRPAVEEPR